MTTATIASSVEEQAAATPGIGRNVSEAARGSGEIAANIGAVAAGAKAASAGAARSEAASRDLTSLADELKGLVGRFDLGDGARASRRPLATLGDPGPRGPGRALPRSGSPARA